MPDASSTRPPRPAVPSRLAMRRLQGLALLAVLVANPAHADSLCAKPTEKTLAEAEALDWVPYDQLTPEQQAALPTACCGAYITPERFDEDAGASPAQSALRASADASEARLQSDILMRGRVEITQGYRSIRADSATYDQATRQAEIRGNIQMREPGLLLRAEAAQVDIDQGNASLSEAQFVLHETRIRGTADSLEKFGDRLFRMRGSRFTSCEPGSNIWTLAGSEIKIHPEEHYGTARHMRLMVFDVPILYSPYARFPVGNQRLTGFLFPSLGFNSDWGIEDAEVPFYWNIAPQYDMTFIPRYTDEHGALLSVEARHLAPLFETQLNTSYMPDDRGNYSQRDRERIAQGIKTDHTGEERWLLQLRQLGGQGRRWTTEVDYTDLSDTDYLRDINPSSLDANRQAYVTQKIAADYRGDTWRLGIKGEEYRLFTQTQLPYRELPRVHANGSYRLDDWRLQLLNEYVRFGRNSNFTGDPASLVPGERLRTDYRLTWNKEWVWGFFKPGVAVRSLSFQLEDNALTAAQDTSLSWHSGQASLDTGLFFERSLNLRDQGYRQTLEPRIFYLYNSYTDQTALDTLGRDGRSLNFDTTMLTFNYHQLFRHTRFAGGDRLDDAEQITLGVSSAWIEESTGLERLRLSLGQINYLEDPRVSLVAPVEDAPRAEKSSPIAAQISGDLNDQLRLTSDLLYDHRSRQLTGASLGLRYRDEDYRIFNIAYRYNREAEVINPAAPLSGRPQDQLDVSTIWPVSRQWSLIARSHYDFHHKLELDTFAGLEYNDCCYRIQLMARRWLDFDYSDNFLTLASQDDYKKGVFMDIQFKGLGNLGEKVGKLLDKAIIGYHEREASLR